MIDDDTTAAAAPPAPAPAAPAAPPAAAGGDRTTLVVAAGTLACLVLGALAWAPWELRWNPDLSITLPSPEATEPPTATPTVPPEEPRVGSDTIMWIFILLGLVVLALLVVVAARAVRAWWSRRPRPVPEAPLTVDTLPGQAVPSREVVADAVAEALARLDGASDPADAVVRAWLALEEAVAREGVVREAAQTQAELTSEVLDATRAPRAATTTLLRTYEAVRYGAVGAGAADVATARACLEDILRALRGGAPHDSAPHDEAPHDGAPRGADA